MHETLAPSLACGKDQYGPDANRRAIAVQVTIGLPGCT
jgi:type IV pilus assembly protein PilV